MKHLIKDWGLAALLAFCTLGLCWRVFGDNADGFDVAMAFALGFMLYGGIRAGLIRAINHASYDALRYVVNAHDYGGDEGLADAIQLARRLVDRVEATKTDETFGEGWLRRLLRRKPKAVTPVMVRKEDATWPGS